MSRLRPLANIDPLSVPLPPGTEVVTRVDRVSGDGRIPSGAVGRVVRATDAGRERLIVKIVGVGEVEFTRGELLARRVGQALQQRQRSDLFTVLAPCVVLETIVGSHAWGLADESSDVDRRGTFVPPFPWTSGLLDPPRDLLSDDATTAHWEIRKAVTQALRADPSTLEMLFVPSARALDDMGEWLLQARGAFVSVAIYGSFGRYALSQLKRLEQSSRLVEHRGRLLQWLREDPDLTLDAAASRLARDVPGLAEHASDPAARAKEHVKQLCRSMHDQGALTDRSFAALKAHAASSASFDVPRELRPKNAYNLLRLIALATGWLRTGEPGFVVEGAFRERLASIKRGDVDLDDVIAEANAMTPALEEARRATRLPLEADLGAADALVRRIGAEAARRHVMGVPGVFGRDAPPPPEPQGASALHGDANGEESGDA